MMKHSALPFSGQSALIQRLVTGLVLMVLITAMVFGGAVIFLLLLLVINHLGLFEFMNLIGRKGLAPQKISVHAAGALLLLSGWFGVQENPGWEFYLLLLAIPSIMLGIELFRGQATPFENVGISLLALLFVSLPLTCFLISAFTSLSLYQPHFILAYFLILWFGDTGAFVTGKLFGHNKLFPRISPQKTWEGSLGGLASAAVAAMLASTFLSDGRPWPWLMLALIINVTGTFGDFGKSMLKRNTGVKDSSNLLPGHGGILDRFDSLFGSAPFVLIYLSFYAKDQLLRY